MKWDAKEVGKIKGEKVIEYTMESKSGTTVKVLNYGAILTEILVKDRFGKFKNIILNHSDILDHQNSKERLGCIIGRTTSFVDGIKGNINENSFNLNKNNVSQNLSGDESDFSRKFWDGTIVEGQRRIALCMKLISKDGEEGYPGNLMVKVNYVLTCEDELIIDVYGISDEDTLLNVTNNIFFNLNGENNEDISNDYLKINSDEVYEVNKDGMLSGNLLNVSKTCLDFKDIRRIGHDLNRSENIENDKLKGCTYWKLNKDNSINSSDSAITLFNKNNLRAIDITTNHEAVQIYTLNEDTSLDENLKTIGICFKTQSPPIGIHEVFKEKSLLLKDSVYNKTTKFRFYIKE